MIKFIMFILALVVILMALLGFSVIRGIRSLFGGGSREEQRSASSHRRTSAASSSAKRKKIIPEEEGEYVEYEEVKE